MSESEESSAQQRTIPSERWPEKPIHAENVRGRLTKLRREGPGELWHSIQGEAQPWTWCIGTVRPRMKQWDKYSCDVWVGVSEKRYDHRQHQVRWDKCSRRNEDLGEAEEEGVQSPGDPHRTELEFRELRQASSTECVCSSSCACVLWFVRFLGSSCDYHFAVFPRDNLVNPIPLSPVLISLFSKSHECFILSSFPSWLKHTLQYFTERLVTSENNIMLFLYLLDTFRVQISKIEYFLWNPCFLDCNSPCFSTSCT